jgi:hypothetical protein
MQVRLSKDRIKHFLALLNSRLPAQPTAAKDFYMLPPHMEAAVLDTSYSESFLQAIADHIGLFMGILTSVKVTIGIEGSDYMIGTTEAIRERSNRTGLFTVKTGSRRKIQITKKHRFELRHVLAILAHESAHNYLFQHGADLPDETENELLTDITCAYLGLGHLLIVGYTPITWVTDRLQSFTGSGYKLHTNSIGYVEPITIYKAIIYSAELRGWSPSSVVSALPPCYPYRFSTFFRLLPYRFRAWKLKKKQDQENQFRALQNQQIELLGTKTEVLQNQLSELAKSMDHIGGRVPMLAIKPGHGEQMVALTNDLALGQTDREIVAIRATINRLKFEPKISAAEVAEVAEGLSRLAEKLKDWNNCLNQYNRR